MQIIKVNNNEEALLEAFNLIPQNPTLNICLTGGNFGDAFLEILIKQKAIKNTWNIYLSDERLFPSPDENLGELYKKKIMNIPGYNVSNLNTFKTNVNPKDSHREIGFKIDSISRGCLDICYLSLGEDGHLAGHFNNSLMLTDNRFCYTKKAAKPPPERVSFNLSWLSKSERFILIALGKKKQDALEDLYSGKGLHSEIWNTKNLILITDIELKI